MAESLTVDQTIAELKKLSAEIKGKSLRAGVVAAIRPVKKDAKSNAPKKEGHLSQAIGHKSLSKRAKSRLGYRENTVALLVGPNRRVGGRYQGRKGLWHEHGTKWMKAKPFMSPALERNQSGMSSRFYTGLAKHLDKLKKL